MMAHVITNACVDVKDGACVTCCPVDCIYEGPRTLYIHPEECINCGLCVSVCPTRAIYDAPDLPAELGNYERINREFFEDFVTGLGSPGGASEVGVTSVDHPEIRVLEQQ
jgi:NAD-dependent dihydropyrimidine dehydrogenase PreA subunit